MLREVEGARSDSGRLLLERLRAGQLEAGGVRLAALLGEPLALRALGGERQPRPASTQELVAALARHGPEALARAAAALGREALAARELEEGVLMPEAEAALAAAETWVLCPCEAHRIEAGRRCGEPPAVHLSGRDRSHAAFHAAWEAGRVAAARDEEARAGHAHAALRWASAALRLQGEGEVGRLLPLLEPWLVPWALGAPDPLKGGVPTLAARRLGDLRARSEAGDAEASGALHLLERAREGGLPPDALELAARLGHAGAALALGEPGSDAGVGEPLAAWLCRLRRRGEALGRAALVLVAPLPLGQAGREAWRRARAALLAGRPSWNADLAEAHFAALQSKGRSPGATADRAAARAACLVWDDGPDAVAELVAALREAGRDGDSCREAARAAILPWLLGGADPLAGPAG